MKFENTAIITNGDLSDDLNSSAIQIYQDFCFAVQGVVTLASSLNGTVNIQGSCDSISGTPTNWTTISGLSVALTANGNFLINVENAGYNWMRLNFSSTSGSGTLHARLNKKGY